MGKVITAITSLVIFVAILGTLGVSIAALITVLNIQDVQNSQLPTTPDATAPTVIPTVPVTVPGAPTTTTKNVPIPVAKPIADNDPRYGAYKGMSDLLKSWMNTSVNPCDDFYSFTCGIGQKNQGMSFDASDDAITESMLAVLRLDASTFKTEPTPVQQLKWFYDVCVANTVTSEERTARSLKIFTDLQKANPNFDFPAVYPKKTAVATPEALGQMLGYIVGTSGQTTLVDVGVDTDWKDPHNAAGGYALLIDQPATIFSYTFYAKIYDEATYKQDIIDGIVDVINAAASLLGEPQPDQKQAAKDAADIQQFDYDLAMVYATDETTRRQYARMYNPYSVDALQKLAPFINWKKYLDNALAPVSRTVDGGFRALVMEVDKLSMLSADIASGKIAARTVNNYINLMAINNNYLPPAATKKLNLLKHYRHSKRPINRKIRAEPKVDEAAVHSDYTRVESNCLDLTNSYLTWANTRIYVDQNYPGEKDKTTVRDQTSSMVRSILVAFRAQIDLLDWMSPAAKKGAYQKIDNLVVNVAFPDWVLDNARLNTYYKKLTTAATESYLTQLDKLKAFSLYEAFSPLVNGAPADRTDFSGPAAITNAWYQPEVNSITFPGGILHAPFYDNSYPAAINYGGLGVIAGHELTHGFDDEGVQWEGTGILNSWMDDNSTKAFTKMAKCVVDEYSGFCPLGPGLPCVDGAQTQGENIADNGGIQAAYKAFKAFEALHGPDPLLPGDAAIFTADQLFFLGFAQVWCQFPPSAQGMLNQILGDPHSPSLYRVLGTVQNIPAFQKAFNCPIDSTYAPVKHCDVWTSEPTSGAPLNEKSEPQVEQNEINVAPVERISPQDMAKYSAYEMSLNTLKASSNLSVNPCDDFYHYTCEAFPGASTTFYDLNQVNYGVINDKLNDKDYQAVITGSKALSKLNTLYNACKDEKKASTIMKRDYLQPKVLKFRNAINQDVPIIGGTGKIAVTPENYGNALGYLSFGLGIDTLVSPMVDTHWLNPQGAIANMQSGYQLFVDQATTFHVRAFYEEKAWPKQKPAYANQVKNVVMAYAKQDTTAKLPAAADLDKMIDDALELERDIAMVYSGKDDQRRQYLRQWNPLAKAAFPPTVDWDKFFAAAPQEAQDWVKTKDVVFNELDYTSKMFTDFTKDKRDETIVNYLFIRVLLDNSGLIPCSNGKCESVMRQLAAAKTVPEHTGRSRLPSGRRLPLPSFMSPLGDAQADAVSCASAMSVMADAQGRVYIDARFPTVDDRDRIRNKTTGVMTNIVDAMKGMIIQLDWMSPETKTRALNKADNIHLNVAFPDYILDPDLLDAKYADLDFAKDDAYYDMLDKVTAYSIGQQYKQLLMPKADRADFLGQTAVVNAWYAPELNSITFPAGILQQPFFDVDFPAGLNYGGIGVVAGHELTHGFDDEGVQWNADGTLDPWMDDGSQKGFNDMAQCVITEYGNFCPLPEDREPHCTDGTRTQGENIADNGGIHSAWRAYQNHIELDGPDALFMDRVYSQFTENQLYFINFAQVWCMQKTYLTEAFVSGRLMTDPHSLGPYRVLGTLQNIPAFQANFNCPLGSTYAPKQHCNVWVPTKMA